MSRASPRLLLARFDVAGRSRWPWPPTAVSKQCHLRVAFGPGRKHKSGMVPWQEGPGHRASICIYMCVRGLALSHVGGWSRCCRSWWAHGSSSPSSWGRHTPQAIPTPTLLPEPPETDSRGPWRPQLYSHGFLLGSSPCPALVPGVYTASFSLGMLLSQFPSPTPVPQPPNWRTVAADLEVPLPSPPSKASRFWGRAVPWR